MIIILSVLTLNGTSFNDLLRHTHTKLVQILEVATS